MDNQERTFTVTKNKKYKKDRSLLPVLIGALILCIVILTPAYKYMSNVYQFNSFMDNLRESFINGQKFNGLNVTYDGNEFQIYEQEGTWIFSTFSLIGKGIKCDEEEIEKPFIIDFGDGSSLLLGESTTKGRYQNEVKAVYLEYTYANGKKYCCKTDQTEFHYLLDPVIKNHTEG